MAILNITAVLYALGWALLHSLWQMGALWLVYQLFLGIPKKWSPAVKHNGSLILLFFGFAWFLATGLSHFREYILVKQFVNLLPQTSSPALKTPVLQQDGYSLLILSDSFKRISESTLTFLELNIGYISAIYLFILVLMMFRFTNAYLYANQLKKKGILPAGAHLNERVVAWTTAMGIHQRVNILLSQRIDIPATIGFLKPVILLPVATVNQLSMDQVESVILHELAHIKRMDYLWNISAAVIETILFFNPFVYLLTSVQKKERELCCDDFVLGFNRDPHNYATALLELEKTRMSGKTMLAMASNGQDGQLLSRVKRILNVQTNKLQYRQRFIALLFITTLMSALAWLQPVQWKNEKPVSVPTSLPAKQWMPDNNPPIPSISDLVKKQVIFDKSKKAPAKKRTEKMEKKLTEPASELSFEEEILTQIDNYRHPLIEKTPFFFNVPPPPPGSQLLQNEINLHDFELANADLIREFTQERKRNPVYINQAPQVRIVDQLADLENQYKRFENSFEFRKNQEMELKSIDKMKDFEKNRELLIREKARIRTIQKNAPSNKIFINGKPIDQKVILDSEQNYTIRIETNDETIEINIGTDSLKRTLIRTPGAAAIAPSRKVTTHSADTYPRNRY
jgi:beta-lactamase regulating signal transducer with metallopeptidase domain